jgi:hypothetical protein
MAENSMPGDLHSEEMRVALQAALSPNQGGPDLRREWMNLASGKESVLGWGEANGFRGVLYMPQVCGPLERPWIDAIEEVLRLLAEQYESDPDEFQEFVDRARRFWPSYEAWDFELERAAVRHGWPLWAIWRLPVHTVRSPEDPWLWLVSDYVKDSVPDRFGVETIEAWPEVRVSLVRADPESVGGFFGVVGALFDRLCRKLRGRFQEDHSRRYLFAEVLERWGRDPKRDRDTVPSWNEARAQIMAGVRMPVTKDKRADETAKRDIDEAAKDVDGLIRQYEENLSTITGGIPSASLEGGQSLLQGLAAMIGGPSQ